MAAEVLGAIGTAADMLAIYEFFEARLRDDHEAFLKSLKKTVKAVCEKAREDLAAFPEFSGTIPCDAEDVIYADLLARIREGRPFTEKDVLPDDMLPRQVHAGLSKVVLQNLNRSLEFYQRNYEALTQRKLDSLSRDVDELRAEMQTLLRAYRYDSAARYHEEPANQSRFHYSNEKARFIGREAQLCRLREFCLADRDCKGRDFAWWAVTGEGGSGKSRLCFELMKQMADAGWTVCARQNHSGSELEKCGRSLVKNTLFLLDYAEYDTSAVFRWLASFNSRHYDGLKVRVLLIQRRGCWEDMKKAAHGELVSIGFVEAAIFSEEFLHIKKLNEDEKKNRALLGEIQKSYALNEKGVSLSLEEADKLYHLLERVDNELLRPLFAIIITDAYHENKDIPQTWGKKDVLDYICEREEALILHATRELFGETHGDAMYRAAHAVLSVATMTGGLIGFNSLCEMLPEREWREVSERGERFCENAVLFSTGANGELNCPALEPDIIGEYFVLRHLRELKRFGQAEKLICAGWRKPDLMIHFISRMFQDHEELIRIEYPELLAILRKVELPKGLQTIKDKAFLKCSTITDITIPESVTSIGSWAFANCISLTRISIPKLVNKIGEGAFTLCTRLTYIDVHNENPFYESENGILVDKQKKEIIAYPSRIENGNLTIPKTIISIGKWAFSNSSSLSEIVIPDTVTSIGKSAFSDCYNLTHVSIPKSVTRIETATFSGCQSLTQILIPESITNIGEMAFGGCYGLTKVTIPDSVISIGEFAFFRCLGLVEVVIPEWLTDIGRAPFLECNSLKDVYVRGKVNDNIRQAFYGIRPQPTFHEHFKE